VLDDRYPGVLAGAAAGDEAAFSELYHDLHPPLLRYLRTLHWELAEDAASEAWIEVARGVAAFQGPEPALRSWVFAIARRKLIDRIRYEARRPSASWEDVEDDGPTERDIADAVTDGDQTLQAVALVRTLPPDQAEAVLLRVMVGMEHAEIAAVMGKTPGAVRVLVHRGLRRLQQRLATQGERTVTP
jgi:RNA polymerase sigma-70 factor (ECF subfamily)